MAVITIPKILREKLSEEGADALVEVINKSDDHIKEDVLTFVEEKFERRLTEEVAKLDKRITEEVAKLHIEIANSRAEIIRWMFVFIVGQFWAIVGVLFAFFRK